MMRSIILALTIFLAYTSRLLIIAGGYQPYTDHSSQSFSDVLSFIQQNYPKLANYEVTSVQRQLVSGFNYNVQLHDNATDCKATAVVYADLAGSYSLTSFNETCPSITVRTPIPPPVVPYRQSPNTIIAGGYIVQDNPSGNDFQNALGQAVSMLYPKYQRSNLVLTETKVVAGTVWRFTFKNNLNGEQQIQIFTPLGGLAQLNPAHSNTSQVAYNNKTQQVSHIVGGYSQVTNQTQYQNAIDAIYSQYPQYKSYQISRVKRQIVAGTNYLVDFQDSSLNTIRQASFKVYIDLSGVATVSQTSWTDVENYTADQISQIAKDSITQHPQIAGYTLIGAENIWPDGRGLKLIFVNGDAKSTIYHYTLKGKQINILF